MSTCREFIWEEISGSKRKKRTEGVWGAGREALYIRPWLGPHTTDLLSRLAFDCARGGQSTHWLPSLTGKCVPRCVSAGA